MLFLSSDVREFWLFASSVICVATAVMMGTIIDVAAVLLIHIDKNHVGNIRPNIKLKKPHLECVKTHILTFKINVKQQLDRVLHVSFRLKCG